MWGGTKEKQSFPSQIMEVMCREEYPYFKNEESDWIKEAGLPTLGVNTEIFAKSWVQNLVFQMNKKHLNVKGNVLPVIRNLTRPNCYTWPPGGLTPPAQRPAGHGPPHSAIFAPLFFCSTSQIRQRSPWHAAVRLTFPERKKPLRSNLLLQFS